VEKDCVYYIFIVPRKCKYVTISFLGNHKAENYPDMVAYLVQCYKAMEYNMPKKVHLLDFLLNFFPENFGAVSDEHGGRFHQDISTMEKRYQGKWGYPLCWLVIDGQLAETLHRQYNSRKSSTVTL